TPERLEIKDFDLRKLANFYPQLYQRRYGGHEQSGYAFLESQMEGKEPSYGYSVLSYLLSETPHRVVVTTNFDNLVADALSIHSSRFPLVIGHDALAQYAAVELRRPLVAKIHGALGFSPKSQPHDISNLPEGWRTALGRILDRYTPIVIGYEGNDCSLMGFLGSLQDHIPDRLFWCVYAPGAKAADCLNLVSSTVRDYVQSRNGRFVPIQGFDELMAKLLTKLREKGSVPDLYQRLKDRARIREQRYDEQQRKLFEAAKVVQAVDMDTGMSSTPRPADSELSKAVSQIAESRKDKPWWVWFQEAAAAPDPETKQTIYQQALAALPDSSDLHSAYASFL
ncbi:MAG TPA: SIR2 family protein, partial [Candidatus Saccharimonadales bacterium]|nr:SIR2 family protein [Candidatus Saccharimonadales bacterium]